MSREKFFRHGQLKAFVNDPFNWYRRHFPRQGPSLTKQAPEFPAGGFALPANALLRQT